MAEMIWGSLDKSKIYSPCERPETIYPEHHNLDTLNIVPRVKSMSDKVIFNMKKVKIGI